MIQTFIQKFIFVLQILNYKKNCFVEVTFVFSVISTKGPFNTKKHFLMKEKRSRRIMKKTPYMMVYKTKFTVKNGCAF